MHLFELIQSMTKSEKRYFKLLAKLGKTKPPKYVQLFDFLNKANPEVDDVLLKKKGFNADDKNLLTEKVLECLQQLKQKKTIESELRLYLEYFQILADKAQWGMLSRYIKRAKKLALLHERFGYAIEIKRWELYFLFKTEKNEINKKNEQLLSELRILNKKRQELLDYVDLTHQIDGILLSDMELSKPQNRADFFRIYESSPLFEKDYKPLSIKAQVDYYYNRSQYFRKKKNTLEIRNCYVKLIELFHEHLFLFSIDQFPDAYLSFVFWERSMALKLGELPYTNDINIEEKIPNLTIFNRFSINLQEVAHCIRTIDKVKGEQHVEQALKNWDKYNLYIKETRQTVLSHAIMVFYGQFEEWEKANFWLQKILSVTRVSDRKDIQIAARTWLFIISYELEPYELDKHAQSIFKFFVRNECHQAFEKQVIKLFRSLYKAKNKQEKTVLFEEMLAYFKHMDETGAEYKKAAHNLKLWCEAKLRNISIIELIKEHKANNKRIVYF